MTPAKVNISPETAKLIHYLHGNKKPHRDIATLLSVSRSVISSALRKYDGNSGLPLPKRRIRSGPPRTTSVEFDAKIVEFHRQNPTISHEKIAEATGLSKITVARRIRESEGRQRTFSPADRKRQREKRSKKGSKKTENATETRDSNVPHIETICSVSEGTIHAPKRDQPSLKKPAVGHDANPEKHPPQIQRPPAEFVIFYCHVRPAVQAQHPSYSAAEMGKEIGEMWDLCSMSDRRKYYHLAEEICTSFTGTIASHRDRPVTTEPPHSATEPHCSSEMPQSPVDSVAATSSPYLEPYTLKLLPE